MCQLLQRHTVSLCHFGGGLTACYRSYLIVADLSLAPPFTEQALSCLAFALSYLQMLYLK